MKKILSVVLMIIIVFKISLTSAFATGGDRDLDGGGSDIGGGTSQNSWTPGNESVRVTVVRTSDCKEVTAQIDFTYKSPSADMFHFGKASKISHKNNKS